MHPTPQESRRSRSPGQLCSGVIQPRLRGTLRYRRRIVLAVLIGSILVVVAAANFIANGSDPTPTPASIDTQKRDVVLPGTFALDLKLKVARVGGWTLLIPTGWTSHSVALRECDLARAAWWLGPSSDPPELGVGCRPGTLDDQSGVLLSEFAGSPEPPGPTATTLPSDRGPSVGGHSGDRHVRLAAVGEDPTGDAAAVVNTSLGPPRSIGGRSVSEEGPSVDDALAEDKHHIGDQMRPGLPQGFGVTDVTVEDDSGALMTGYRFLATDAASVNDRFVRVCVSTDPAVAVSACNGPAQTGFARSPSEPTLSPSTVGDRDVRCWAATGCIAEAHGHNTWFAIRVDVGNLTADEFDTITRGD